MPRKPLLLIAAAALLIVFAAVVVWQKEAFQTILSSENSEWTARNVDLKKLDETLKKLGASIQEQVEGHSACKYDDECRVVGLGNETCGGYKDYVIYSSTAVEDEGNLLRAINQFNELFKKKSDLELVANSCGFKSRPARCISKQCSVE